MHAPGETGRARLALELRAALGPLAADHERMRAGQLAIAASSVAIPLRR